VRVCKLFGCFRCYAVRRRPPCSAHGCQAAPPAASCRSLDWEHCAGIRRLAKIELRLLIDVAQAASSVGQATAADGCAAGARRQRVRRQRRLSQHRSGGGEVQGAPLHAARLRPAPPHHMNCAVIRCVACACCHPGAQKRSLFLCGVQRCTAHTPHLQTDRWWHSSPLSDSVQKEWWARADGQLSKDSLESQHSG